MCSVQIETESERNVVISVFWTQLDQLQDRAAHRDCVPTAVGDDCFAQAHGYQPMGIPETSAVQVLLQEAEYAPTNRTTTRMGNEIETHVGTAGGPQRRKGALGAETDLIRWPPEMLALSS
jgi:hypothetical protein